MQYYIYNIYNYINYEYDLQITNNNITITINTEYITITTINTMNNNNNNNNNNRITRSITTTF